MGRLSATFVKADKAPGRYADGDGLYLVVAPSGSKSWVCRVQKEGKRRDIGLGSVKKVSLAQARDRSGKVRTQVEAGLDPILERKKEAGIPTFREAAALVFAENRAAWKNKKHAGQWLSTLIARRVCRIAISRFAFFRFLHRKGKGVRPISLVAPFRPESSAARQTAGGAAIRRRPSRRTG